MCTTSSYTILKESRYIVVKDIPALGNIEQIIHHFQYYGTIQDFGALDEIDQAAFTDTVWILYEDIYCARNAKQNGYKRKYIAAVLNIQYAPEMENVEQLSIKLTQRRLEIEKYLPASRNKQPKLMTQDFIGPLLCNKRIKVEPAKKSFVIQPASMPPAMMDTVAPRIEDVPESVAKEECGKPLGRKKRKRI